jgi:hypothetical protein
MEPSEVSELKLAAPVWVWIVYFGRDRWWPGTVEEIDTKGPPLVRVRFESFSRAADIALIHPLRSASSPRR